MVGPVAMLQDSLSLALKKPSLIFGLISFIVAIVISLGILLVGGILVFGGIFVLAAINNMIITILGLIVAGILGIIVMLLLQSAVEIFMYTGFRQIMQTGNYNLDNAFSAVKDRIIPTSILLFGVLILQLAIMAIIGIPMMLIAQALNMNIFIILFLILVYAIAMVAVSPLLITAMPRVCLERTGGIKALLDSIRGGTRNYAFNLKSILLIGVIVVVLLIPMMIPLVGIIIGFFLNILLNYFYIKIYEENKANSR